MAVTRRLFVSGAMAMPLLGQMGGTAHAAADPAFTLLDGLGELQTTELARTRLAAEGIEIQAVAPAVPITGADGAVTGVRMTPEYATGTIALTGRPGAGSARLEGGVVLASPMARMEITGIRGSLPDNRVFAFLKVNDEWVGEVPLYTGDPAAVRLSVVPGVPGKPTVIKGSGIPITPTQEGLDAFAEAFGTTLFTTTDVVFTSSGEGTAWPLPFLPIG
jgi:hypothetical protein